MIKILLLLLCINILGFSGGEISFKKQKEKEIKIENAKIEAIKSNISDSTEDYSEEIKDEKNTEEIEKKEAKSIKKKGIFLLD